MTQQEHIDNRLVLDTMIVLVDNDKKRDMDISISTTFDPKMPLAIMMPMVAAAGFARISLAGGNYEESKYLAAEGRQHVNSLCEASALVIDSIHAPLGSNIDIANPQERIRDFSVDLMKKALYACCEVKCPVLVLHLCNRFPENELAERIVAVRTSLNELVPYAYQKNIHLAIENLIGESANVLFERMLGEFRQEHVGVCYDTSHAYLTGNMYSLLETYGKRIIALHVSDNKGQLDDHMLPFEGAIDWAKFTQAFSRIDFQGTFLLEVELRESLFKDPKIFLEQAYARALKLIASCNQSS